MLGTAGHQLSELRARALPDTGHLSDRVCHQVSHATSANLVHVDDIHTKKAIICQQQQPQWLMSALVGVRLMRVLAGVALLV